MTVNPIWINEAIDLYDQGLSYTEIGKRISVNRKTVSFYLKKNGITPNPKFSKYISKVPLEKLRKYDYSYCDHIFDVIDTEEKAYWLGFLYADGYISDAKTTVELSLKEEDYNHIIKFRKFLKLENKPITKKIKHFKNGVDKTLYKFSFNSQSVKDNLIKLGCFPNKTFFLKFPTEDIVPKNLIHHFIRGYIDGDGCIYVSKKNIISVEVIGTEDFLIGYKKWVNLGHNKIYNCSCTSVKRAMYFNKQALNLLERLYKDSNIYLERKYNIYKNFLAQF